MGRFYSKKKTLLVVARTVISPYMATWEGWSNFAFVRAGPSSNPPSSPPPAMVVTISLTTSTLRMQWFQQSATIKFPSLSKQIPRGPENVHRENVHRENVHRENFPSRNPHFLALPVMGYLHHDTSSGNIIQRVGRRDTVGSQISVQRGIYEGLLGFPGTTGTRIRW